MDLITYDAQNAVSRRSEDPMVHFCKSGLITINSSAVEKLNLSSDSLVAFHQDKAKRKDWYLEIRTANGLKLRTKVTAKNRSLCLNSSIVCKEVLKSLTKDKSVKIPVSIVPTDGKYYALLTSTLK